MWTRAECDGHQEGEAIVKTRLVVRELADMIDLEGTDLITSLFSIKDVQSQYAGYDWHLQE
jgi:hypothetical protein